MGRMLQGLAFIVATALSNNSSAVLTELGNRIAVYDQKNQRSSVPFSGSCNYEGYTLHLSCDLERPSPKCTITETYDGSGKKMEKFPDDIICLPKVAMQYPRILFCFGNDDCDKEFMCC